MGSSRFTQAKQAMGGDRHRSNSCVEGEAYAAARDIIRERRKSSSDAEIKRRSSLLGERGRRLSGRLSGLMTGTAAAAAASAAVPAHDGNDKDECSESFNDGAPPEQKSPFLHTDKVDTETVLICAVKFADLGHCFKPWALHKNWTERITEEFWALGDREKSLGMTVGPLCDRLADTDIPKSQVGFFQFICRPFYSAVAELVEPGAIFFQRCEANAERWHAMHERSAERSAETKTSPSSQRAARGLNEDGDTDSFDSRQDNFKDGSGTCRRTSSSLSCASTSTDNHSR